ncbi:hypothetical protein [Holospora curviuscula]|uniref:hypothetical protein n=1 Tax=Holospora curviuscula TaxID=1082868 RepID=UPI000CE5904D|nr:hypothetical protein [Holospora curviuscula]
MEKLSKKELETCIIHAKEQSLESPQRREKTVKNVRQKKLGYQGVEIRIKTLILLAERQKKPMN